MCLDVHNVLCVHYCLQRIVKLYLIQLLLDCDGLQVYTSEPFLKAAKAQLLARPSKRGYPVEAVEKVAHEMKSTMTSEVGKWMMEPGARSRSRKGTYTIV
jgi:hypothetical protein